MCKLLVLLAVGSGFAFAQSQISLEEIPENMGKKVKICDKIYGSYVTKGNSPVTLLNVGKDYPDSPLTLVIYQKDKANFSYVPEDYLVGKSFCTIGKLVEFKGKPQIVLKSEKDLEIL